MSPWTPDDVVKHNRKAANSPKKSRMWSDVANKVLAETGNDGLAIREANAVVNRSGRRRNPR